MLCQTYNARQEAQESLRGKSLQNNLIVWGECDVSEVNVTFRESRAMFDWVNVMFKGFTVMFQG